VEATGSSERLGILMYKSQMTGASSNADIHKQCISATVFEQKLSVATFMDKILFWIKMSYFEV
jgi:hypothetical protein